jgi:hypothetical protein
LNWQQSPFDGLSIWPGASNSMLPGARQNMMAGDDDDDDDDDDDGEFTEKPTRGGKKSQADDDDDDDRPRKKRKGDDDEEEEKKGGMGMGMIVGIVAVLLLCCVCVPLGGVGVIFLGGGLRTAAGNAQTMNNMKQIALSCQSYHDANKFLPSPRMAQADLSWRVDILPYIDHGAMFQQIMANPKAWNDPANQRFQTMMPATYINTGKQSSMENSKTHFQYFTGPGSMFPDNKAKISLMKIIDGTSNTILFADSAGTVTWIEPRDMTTANLNLPPDRFLAAMCDGTVRTIDRKKANDAVLRNLINPSDNQPIPPGVLD